MTAPAAQISMTPVQHGLSVSTWSDVANQTLVILMVLGDSRGPDINSDSVCYGATDPDKTLCSNPYDTMAPGYSVGHSDRNVPGDSKTLR